MTPFEACKLQVQAEENQRKELQEFIHENKLQDEFKDFVMGELSRYQQLQLLKQFYWWKTSQEVNKVFEEEGILMSEEVNGIPEEDMLDIIELYGDNKEE